MNILVCVKQVPDINELKTDTASNSLPIDKAPKIVNTLDAYALETAVRLKDADAATKIVVLTMGSESAKEALKSALSVGADKAYRVGDDALADSDTLATSYLLSSAAKTLEAREGLTFDLILCGKQASDGDTAQVGSQLAEHLGYPQITSALEISVADGKVRARRETGDGFEVVETALPAVVTISKTEYEPRYASVKTKMAANRAEIPVLTVADLELDAARIGLAGSPTKLRNTYVPQRKTGGVKLEEENGEIAAEKLATLLSDAGII
ncbi:MAG: electron transfer flavoprotein subunit beta/FixA family protein [Oscillospiraceae bacterium]|jgi:electron transfer flavoprotein beta subunit|nr:electron transfer flavoprotein subunit beta/FixA family protein [Oscillospiraceae bacterium]